MGQPIGRQSSRRLRKPATMATSPSSIFTHTRTTRKRLFTRRPIRSTACSAKPSLVARDPHAFGARLTRRPGRFARVLLDHVDHHFYRGWLGQAGQVADDAVVL